MNEIVFFLFENNEFTLTVPSDKKQYLHRLHFDYHSMLIVFLVTQW